MTIDTVTTVRKSIVRRVGNRILHLLARSLPGGSSLRPFLHRLRGVRIHGKVYIGDNVYLENEYPESVEIHEGAQILLKSTFIAHHRGPGRIVIGQDALIGACSVLLTGPGCTLTVGDGSVIRAGSVVTTNVPPGVLLGGNPAVALARVGQPLTAKTSYREFLAGLREF